MSFYNYIKESKLSDYEDAQRNLRSTLESKEFQQEMKSILKKHLKVDIKGFSINDFNEMKSENLASTVPFDLFKSIHVELTPVLQKNSILVSVTFSTHRVNTRSREITEMLFVDVSLEGKVLRITKS